MWSRSVPTANTGMWMSASDTAWPCTRYWPVASALCRYSASQVFVVHARWQPRGVGVPGHQVAALLAFAHQVLAHAARPDQVARVQELERAGHLLAADRQPCPR
jgi:hypothetical protein